MITRLSHVTIFVLDQDTAYDFYVNKLGFEVRTDSRLEGFRWLTVGPKAQPDFELVLMPIQTNPMLDAAACEQVKSMVAKGLMGGGVFNTDNCRKTYEDLVAKGVEFVSPPTERPYGIEAVFKDSSGNWFSMTQHH